MKQPTGEEYMLRMVRITAANTSAFCGSIPSSANIGNEWAVMLTQTVPVIAKIIESFM